MAKSTCPVCRYDIKTGFSAGDLSEINCAFCGKYRIVGTAEQMFISHPIVLGRDLANARGWMRENQEMLVGSDDVLSIRTAKPPSVGERAERLLRIIVDASPGVAAQFNLKEDSDEGRRVQALTWSANFGEIWYLAREYLAKSKKWLEDNSTNSGLGVVITPDGHNHLDERSKGGTELDSGFCAMWFSSEITFLWVDAIEPAIRGAGYKPIRIDNVEHNNKIDDEILANIRRSRFVIADFTGHRGGVYFEAGFALGLGRPVIWTVKEDELKEVHFDNRQYRFTTWNETKINDFRQALQVRIEATIGRGPYAS
ncbi:MAG: hypothetical protein V4695_12265 [Pseudomonadota bacterium]